MMKRCTFSLILLMIIVITGCEAPLKNEWATEPFTDAYGNTNRISLKINGERLSPGLTSAEIRFAQIEDLISGGYKEVFSVTMNGKSASDEMIVIDAAGQEYIFTCYDGYIFDIDSESNVIETMIGLMENKELIFRQGDQSFTISTMKFTDLYEDFFGSEQKP